PTQDYNSFLKGYSALADAGVHFVNNSWGSNRKVASAFEGATGYKLSSGHVTETNDPGDHMYLKDLQTAKKAYYQFILTGEKSFMDAAYEVAINKEMIQVFTAGNRSLMPYPFTRAMLPYFRPDAEKYWVNVTGQYGRETYPLQGSSSNPMPDTQVYNEASEAKWWTIAAPAIRIYSGYVDLNNEATYGSAMYRYANGTSMAAPHVTGALGVIQSRYMYMTPSQVRDVMLTNARRTKFSDGTTLERWTAQDGVPDTIWGWGILDLGGSMFGPGQFLGTFDVNMNVDDMWSSNISDKAIKFRKTEDETEAATWATRKAALDAQLSLSEEEKAEYEVELARQAARDEREAQGYEGVLIKRGNGTLTLAGDNTFTGVTTIYGGKISALNQSIGNSQNIIVENGGALEILKDIEYKTPSGTGYQTTNKASSAVSVKAVIKDGGTFVVNNGVANLNLKFESGSLLKTAEVSLAELENLAANPTQKIVYAASGSFENINNAAISNDYAFFNILKEVATNTNLQLALMRGADMAEVADSKNAKTIAAAIENATSSEIYRKLLGSTTSQAKGVFNYLSNDYDFAAQNNSLVNLMMMKNGLLNQSGATRANIDTGVDIWTASILNRVTTDKNFAAKFASGSFAQFVGIDFSIGDSSKIGTLVGVGRTNNKIDGEKEFKNKDLHFGIYGETAFEPVKLSFNAIYTKSDRDRKQAYAPNSDFDGEYINSDQTIASTFAEAAFTGFNNENFGIEPYFGLGYMHAKTDGANNKLANIDNKTRDIEVATLGIRPSIPFVFDGIDLKATADLAYNRFLGDKAPEADVDIAGVGKTHLKGEELKDLTTLNLGIEMMLTKSAKFSLTYVGAYGSDIKSNGINAKFSLSF
ncbi:MAG: autotransporter domain-containing protein, partial [Campylobacter sp.]|nr:autotransporter domain-containing protein [Campylobacter sp.]